MNGAAPAADAVLAPSGWSDYERRVLYRSFDVGPLLAADGASNVVAVELGQGWRDTDAFARPYGGYLRVVKKPIPCVTRHPYAGATRTRSRG